VGHPLLEEVLPSRDILRRELGVADGEKLITLLPGSRALELRYIAPHVAAAAEVLSKQYSTSPIRFLVAVPPGATQAVRRYFPASIPILEGRSAEALSAADVAIVKSGTATLEAAVAGVAQAVVYDVPLVVRLQWLLMGMQKKAPLVAMPNIILERMAVPELIAINCKGHLIARAVGEILEDAALQERIQQDYLAVRRALGSELPVGATIATADILDEMLE
jgi:lipid-A-disaccharide synthase